MAMSLVSVHDECLWTMLTLYVEKKLPEDPNLIPPSPSLSALQRLSIMESPPSASSTGSRTPTQDTVALPITTSATPLEPPTVPSKTSLRSLARAPELKSSVSTIRAAAAAQDSQLLQQPQIPTDAGFSKPKSKLSALASSRSSASSSRSSLASSVRSASTYPALRPSPNSAMGIEDAASSVITSSSTSSHVRRAIETALQLEDVESLPPATNVEPATRARGISIPNSPTPKEVSVRSTSPVKSAKPLPPSPVTNKSPTTSEGKPKTSKLAQLAQAKAQQAQSSGQTHWIPKAKRPVSETPNLVLHKSHTEYLTPIANGPTATTAITTTYQSLASLARPTRSDPAAQELVNMFDPKIVRSSTESKHSKLALKSKKARKAVETQPEPEQVPEDALSALDLPMFTPMNMQSRASPSAFASLLLSDDSSPIEAKSQRQKDRESSRAREHREVVEKPRRRMHKRHEAQLPPDHKSSSEGFAFDVPSPDDIVFKARHGTSLAHRSSSTTSHLPPSNSSATSSRSTVPSRS
jgi:hypothetical protein